MEEQKLLNLRGSISLEKIVSANGLNIFMDANKYEYYKANPNLLEFVHF